MYRLLCATDPRWLEVVLADFNSFLLDHAACERKASAMAMSMVVHYPDREQLVTAMADLAIEELNHFRQVLKLIRQRGLQLVSDSKDPYISVFSKALRHGREDYFLDKLLMASIVEARGFERFALLAQALAEPQAQQFYRSIAQSEEKHFHLFLSLAGHYFAAPTINARLDALLQVEADIVTSLEFRAALH